MKLSKLSQTILSMLLLVSSGFSVAHAESNNIALGFTPETFDSMYNKEIDTEFVQTVVSSLPERVVNQEFISPNYDATLALNADNSTVSVTFISEGAGYRNSVGYYTFNDGAFDGLTKANVDINGNGGISIVELDNLEGVNVGWLFPNSSALNSDGMLQVGNTMDVAGLNANQNIGFFLLPNAWNGNTVTGIGASEAYFTNDFLNPESWSGAASDGSSIAPAYWDGPDGWGDLSKIGYNADGSFSHTTLLASPSDGGEIILSFEDLKYGGDKDYNDAVFMITATPPNAFGDSNIATAPVPSLSGGVFGLLGTIGVMMMGGRRRKA